MRYILITGARDYPNLDLASFVTLDAFDRSGTILIHGNARGVDRTVADTFSRHINLNPMLIANGSNVLPFRAEWGKYGRAAGPIRNREMVNYVVKQKKSGHTVICFAFPLMPRQAHSGTWDCIDSMQAAGLMPIIYPALTSDLVGVD